MTKEKFNQFVIDPKKIGKSKQAEDFKKATIKDVLEKIGEKKPFGPGDIVTTLDGLYAHKGLMVVEIKDDGMVRIAPEPNTPTIEIPGSDLWHFDDYHEAFKAALVEEQNINLDKPQ